MRRKSLLALAFVIGLTLIFGRPAAPRKKEPAPPPAPEIKPDAKAGRRAYRRAYWTTTGLTCTHCHAHFNERKDPFDRKVRPGHPLYNSAHRAIWQDYRGEKILDLKQAIKVCIDTWVVVRPPAEQLATAEGDSGKATKALTDKAGAGRDSSKVTKASRKKASAGSDSGKAKKTSRTKAGSESDSGKAMKASGKRAAAGSDSAEAMKALTGKEGEDLIAPAWDYTEILTNIALYLEEISPEQQSKPIDVTRTGSIPSDIALKRGNLVKGKAIFEKSCSICHAEGPAPSLYRNGYTHREIARKVRGLTKTGIAGVIMPGFSVDRLSNMELLDIVAYVARM